MRRVLPGPPKLKVKRMFRDLKCSSGELSHHLIWLRARRESKRGERDGERGGGGRWTMASSHLIRANWHARIPPNLPACCRLPYQPCCWSWMLHHGAAHIRLRSYRCAYGSHRPTDSGPAHLFASLLLHGELRRARTLDGILLKCASADRLNSRTHLARCGWDLKLRVRILCVESEAATGGWARRSWRFTVDGSCRSSSARWSRTRVKRHEWKSLRESLGLFGKQRRIKTTHKSGAAGWAQTARAASV